MDLFNNQHLYIVLFINALFGDIHGMAMEEKQIKIGVIADNKGFTSSQNEQRHSSLVYSVWHKIDTAESYQVYKSVRRFDEDDNISFIVFLDYDPRKIDANLLHVRHKELVTWKTFAGYENFTRHNETEQADVVFSRETGLHKDPPYCIYRESSNTTQKGTKCHSEDSVITTVSRALSKFCTSLKWTSVFMFYETKTEKETMAVMDEFSDKGVMTTLHNIDHVDDIGSLLLQIYLTTVPVKQEINFVVICRYQCVRKILKTANAFDRNNPEQKTLLNQFSRWLVVHLDHAPFMSHEIMDAADDLDNVVMMSVPDLYFPPSEFFPEVLNETVLLLEYLYFSTYEGLLPYLKERIPQKLATYNPATRCSGFHVDTLLWATSGRSFSKVASVDVEGGVRQWAKFFPNTDYGYSGRQFTISVLPYPPFVIRKIVNGSTVYEGMFIELLKELTAVMNFTYVLKEPEDGKWGSFIDKENLIFNGMVGQLQRKEADFAAAPLVIQADRAQVVDFSYTIYHEYTSILMKKPDPSATKWKTLLYPFKSEVLLSIGISLPIATLMAFLIEKYGHFYEHPENAGVRESGAGLHTLHDSFWYMYGALLCQGGVYLPSSFAGRTFISGWWIFCIIVVGIYCGNLIAFLTVSKQKPPFETLEEMAEMSGDLEWGTLGGTFWEVVFEISSIPLYRRIGDAINRFKKDDPDILNINTGFHVNRVKQGGYAWIGDKTTMELAMSKECDLQKTKEEFLPMKYAYAFQKNSPHTYMFSKQIMKTHEGGLIEMWKRKFWPKSNFCSTEVAPQAKPITLADVQSAFYVCCLGTVLGTIVFFIELIIFRLHGRRKRQSEDGDSVEERTNM